MFKKRSVKKRTSASTGGNEHNSVGSSSSSKRKILYSDDEDDDASLNDLKSNKGETKDNDTGKDISSEETVPIQLLSQKKRKLKDFSNIESVDFSDNEQELAILSTKRQHQESTKLIEQMNENAPELKEQTGNSTTQPYHKVNVLMDYQPELCKDYKLTGFCGYGDSCKFIHSRDDFVTGWKLTTDWRTGVALDKATGSVKGVAGDHSHQNGSKNKVYIEIPFKCVLCKNDYTKPIVTNCGHYFCQKCFLVRMKSNSNCFICGKDTQGVMKPVSKLVSKSLSTSTRK